LQVKVKVEVKKSHRRLSENRKIIVFNYLSLAINKTGVKFVKK
jgi:hypothetical protein